MMRINDNAMVYIGMFLFIVGLYLINLGREKIKKSGCVL